MYEVTLVVHSNHSPPSNRFLKLVEELLDFEAQNEVTSDIVVIPIDYNNEERPKAFFELMSAVKGIDRVPTVIPKNTVNVLSGKEAFEWINTEIRKYKKLPGVVASSSNPLISGDKFTSFGAPLRSFVPENGGGVNPGRMKMSDATFDSVQQERKKLLADTKGPTNQPAPWTINVKE
jgi:hypothetical protein